MELWQFNNYVKGYEKRMREQQKQNIVLAWHTAVFNNQKKIKPLKQYLDNIDKNDKKKYKTNFSKEKQLEQIEKIKNIDRGE